MLSKRARMLSASVLSLVAKSSALVWELAVGGTREGRTMVY